MYTRSTCNVHASVVCLLAFGITHGSKYKGAKLGNRSKTFTVQNVDNSDYMRNGDFVPTRLQAQQDAVNLVCHSKTRSNPENNVGLIVMSNVEVLTTLTSDVGRILSKLHQVQPKGEIRFCTAVKVAHLALKHRQGKNHRMRIVVFVGSPVEDDEKEIVKLAKKLKKEKVNVDMINFGEEGINTERLTQFINTINGKDGTGSHLVTVPPGPLLSEALVNSPVIVGEDGAGVPLQATGFEFGVDPNEDPELALALRVSMEEQRARQEEEARKEQNTPSVPDFGSMSEEDQIAFALQMSMSADNSSANTPAPMETDAPTPSTAADKSDADKGEEDIMHDRDFLQQVLESLPGVDPNSEAIQSAMSSLTKDSGSKQDKDKKDEGKK
ncbi:PSMD4-like protein [Mya arenaria]|uniref:26S proteasome non-ATPase regulatory subunit 4 n=1 Tax=Mya arenaria TaxID=6604 RepID=A0ABY7FGV9_MYAAR|nr:PSMD4-like protein [Mya arenaria]